MKGAKSQVKGLLNLRQNDSVSLNATYVILRVAYLPRLADTYSGLGINGLSFRKAAHSGTVSSPSALFSEWAYFDP